MGLALRGSSGLKFLEEGRRAQVVNVLPRVGRVDWNNTTAGYTIDRERLAPHGRVD